MIQPSYPYHFIQKDKGDGVVLLSTSLYRFKSEKSHIAYIVLVEHYKFNVYAVKFYPKNNSQSKNKYRILTHTFEPRRIINTCVNIMLEIYAQNSKASFGFVGANSIGEDSCCTKRYRFYANMMATYFTGNFFYHKENPEKSAYMMVNLSQLAENEQLIEEIEEFFVEQFNFTD